MTPSSLLRSGLCVLVLTLGLSSCATSGPSPRANASPQAAQARKAVLDSLGDMTVKNQWVSANRTDYAGGGSLDKAFGSFSSPSKPSISSDISNQTIHYSGWRLGEDNVLRAHYTSQQSSTSVQISPASSGEVEIPLLKTDRIFVHDQEISPELHKAIQEDSPQMFEDMLGKMSHQTLSENLTHTATVEFVRGKGKPLNNTYDRIYFPNMQRAQQFVSRWNALVATLRQ